MNKLNHCPKCGRPGGLDSTDKNDKDLWCIWYFSCSLCNWQWDVVADRVYIDNQKEFDGC